MTKKERKEYLAALKEAERVGLITYTFEYAPIKPSWRRRLKLFLRKFQKN